MRILIVRALPVVGFALVLACRPTMLGSAQAGQGATAAAAGQATLPQVDIIHRTLLVSHLDQRDSLRQRLQQGHLTLIVRSADRPQHLIDGADVMLRDADDGQTRTVHRVRADAGGVVTLDTLAAGEWLLEVRHIGYQRVRASIAITPGCRERVELYLPMDVIRLDGRQYERMAPRMTVTTCASDA